MWSASPIVSPNHMISASYASPIGFPMKSVFQSDPSGHGNRYATASTKPKRNAIRFGKLHTSAMAYDGPAVLRLIAFVTLIACQPPRAPVPSIDEGLVDRAKLLAARDREDVAAMRGHAWRVWERIQPDWQS